MATLTEGEQKLFARYWGQADLVDSDGFWKDAYELLSKDAVNIPMPLKYNPMTVRMIHDLLVCEPGKCGECCRYGYVPIFESDIKRIVENGACSQEKMDKLVIRKEGAIFLSGQPQCPFLVDNACSIYKYRPDNCFMFPVQGGSESMLDGKKISQLQIRFKCPSTLTIVRKIITEAMKQEPNLLLLPNLTIIHKEA